MSAADVASVNASLQVTKASLATLEATVAGISGLATQDVNSFYLMVCGIVVFFMQAGFALLEAGSVRAKNTKNILMKNLLDACIGAIVWWGWGYGLAYDGGSGGAPGGFINFQQNTDSSLFAKGYATATSGTGSDGDSGAAYSAWWFQYVFCAATATIVSGAMAERTTLIGYLCYTVWITGFIYPVVVAWSWGYGWAYRYNGGLVDFAGSGIVHMTGGIAAIVGAAIVGPRKGRFDESKKPIAMPAHNTTFQVLGTFILWVGWYGFNPGSTLGLAGYGGKMSHCIVTTTLSASMGGITTLMVDKMLISHTWDVGMLCNGILGGLVSITAGCHAMYPWAALISGMLGGLIYIASSKCVLHICKVDDPLDAFSVHGTCGFWGVMAAALFASENLYSGTKGLFYGNGAPLWAGLLFCICDICWTGFLAAFLFLPLKMAGLLRVSADVEDAGMDVSKHGGSAYSSS